MSKEEAFARIRNRMRSEDFPMHLAADIEQIICEVGNDWGEVSGSDVTPYSGFRSELIAGSENRWPLGVGKTPIKDLSRKLFIIGAEWENARLSRDGYMDKLIRELKREVWLEGYVAGGDSDMPDNPYEDGWDD